MKKKLQIFFIALIALALARSPKLDASCCSSAATGGIARLLPHERALFEMSSGMRYAFGSFDQNARFAPGHLSHLPHMIFEQELQAMVRITHFFEPFVRMPARIQKSDVRTGANLADMTLGARLPIMRENFYHGWPGVAMLTSLRMPTGASYAKHHLKHSEDITSMGEWLITLGIALEKELLGITYGLGYGISLEPSHFKSAAIKTGLIHAPFLTLGFFPHEGGFLSFSLSPTIHGSTTANGSAIDNSNRRKFSLGSSYALILHSHVKINAQLGCDVPILGKNYNSEFFMRLSMRMGIF